MVEFEEKLGKLQKALTATQEAATEAGTRLDSINARLTPRDAVTQTARDALNLQRGWTASIWP